MSAGSDKAESEDDDEDEEDDDDDGSLGACQLSWRLSAPLGRSDYVIAVEGILLRG